MVVRLDLCLSQGHYVRSEWNCIGQNLNCFSPVIHRHLTLWPRSDSCHHEAVNVKNINRILAVINRTYSNKPIENMMYKSLVRPILEYIHQAWYPWLIKDMQKAVRRWGTKMKNIFVFLFRSIRTIIDWFCRNCRGLIWR